MKKYSFLVVMGIGLLPFSAIADETSPLESVYACASIGNDDQRLRCFDAAVAAARKSQDEGEFTTLTRKDAEKAQKEAFGFSLPSLPKLALPSLKSDSADPSVKTGDDGLIEELELEIASISSDSYGRVIVRFANGQVWEQADSSKIVISRKRPPTSAVIKKASLGSFLIRLNTQQRFKARRVE